VAPIQIREGLYQFKVPMRANPLGYTFSYLLSDSRTLIDTGIPSWDAYAALEKQLAEVGLKATGIDRVVLTHLHNDHAGLINYLRERSTVDVLAHRVAIERQEEQIRVYRELYQATSQELQLMGGGAFQQFLSRFERAFSREDAERLRIDQPLDDGQTLELGSRKLRVIWTPGHAVEHICLYDAERKILFSGDHVLPKITSHVSLHTWEERDPLCDYIASLEKVRDLPVDIILPGHERSFTDLSGRVDQLKAHHRARLDEVKQALKSGRSTIFDIAGAINWDSRPWVIMDFWTKRMAATETYAHLVYLRNKGEVSETKVEGVLTYKLA
jgi:glyoxylase-like metal-dependent hydrolase (beta-lactamase superfamily II)